MTVLQFPSDTNLSLFLDMAEHLGDDTAYQPDPAELKVRVIGEVGEEFMEAAMELGAHVV